MLHRVAIAALIVVVCSALRPWAAPQGSPTFRTNVDLIEVDVRVTDQRGVPVRDLTAEDFAILEDGVPQPVATFSFVDLGSAAPVKNTNVLSVDADVVSNDIPGRMWVLLIGGFGERARLVARSFINDALSPIDDVAIVFAHGNMSAAQGFTRNRRLLLDAIDRAVGRVAVKRRTGQKPHWISGPRGSGLEAR
jgi:VWFA-related protein